MQGLGAGRQCRTGKLVGEGPGYIARAALLRQPRRRARSRSAAAADAGSDSTATATAAGHAPPPDLSRLLTSRAFTPDPFVGPVAPQLIPGAAAGGEGLAAHERTPWLPAMTRARPQLRPCPQALTLLRAP